MWLEAQFQKKIGSTALTVFFDDSPEPECHYWNVALDIIASVLQTKKKKLEKKRYKGCNRMFIRRYLSYYTRNFGNSTGSSANISNVLPAASY